MIISNLFKTFNFIIIIIIIIILKKSYIPPVQPPTEPPYAKALQIRKQNKSSGKQQHKAAVKKQKEEQQAKEMQEEEEEEETKIIKFRITNIDSIQNEEFEKNQNIQLGKKKRLNFFNLHFIFFFEWMNIYRLSRQYDCIGWMEKSDSADLQSLDQ